MTNYEMIRRFAQSVDTVYEQLVNMEQYPMWMKNIDRVTVLTRVENTTETKWEATLDGRKITWTERDVYDADAHTITYKLIEGDMSEMEGSWQVSETEDGGCEVRLQGSFSFGIPMMALFIEPILKRKLEENGQMLMDGIDSYLSMQYLSKERYNMSRGQKLVLIYQMDESKDRIKEVAKKFQIQTKTISREMIGESMGHLIGRKGFGAAKAKMEDETMTEPMIVMDGLQGASLNSFLKALQEADLFVPLKAIITPINLTWPFCKLYHAIEEEDREMRQAK